MSELKNPTPAFLFASFLYNREFHSLDHCQRMWEDFAGTAQVLIPDENPLKRYYSEEMGPQEDLGRVFFLTPELIFRERLLETKLWATEQEKRTSQDGGRTLNIDPGLLTAENLVLATGKNFGHRIYIGQGVYGDLTLMFQKGQFCQLPWSYPDYLTSDKLKFFTNARKLLLSKGANSQNF